MLNLAEKYWAWRNRKPSTFLTTKGYKVVKIDDKWVVKNAVGQRYLDLKGPHSWSKEDFYFKDCLGDRDTVEKRFGKILDEEYENTP